MSDATVPSGPQEPDELAREVERLRQENEALRTGNNGRRVALWRSIAAGVCLVLAAVLTVPAVVGFWGQRTITDAQRYLDTVGPLAAQPEVQEVVADAVVKAFQERVDVQALVQDTFGGVIADRPRLQALVPLLSTAVDNLVSQTAHRVVASPQFQQLWLRVNAVAQQALIDALEGETNGAVQLQGDQVVLDIGTVIDEVKKRLVDAGLTILDRVPIPQVDRQVVLLDAPALAQARTIWTFAKPISFWLLPIVVLLFAGACLLARRRARMVLTVGVVLVVAAAVLAIALSAGESQFGNALQGTVFGPASTVFWETLFSYLHSNVAVLAVLGVILAVVGWLAGGTRGGIAVRRWIGRALAGGGAALPEGPLSTAGAWLARRRTAAAVVVVVLGVLVLLLGGTITVAKVLWTLVAVLVVLAVIQVLAGAARSAAGPEPMAADPVATGPAAAGPPAVPPGNAGS
ncbi:MAG: hypothetical protein EPO13_12200 [Actinomycetota bacterium]|nr:MAG: hypothetical protein EPO13_12200 [Actinomycetota bacterium]